MFSKERLTSICIITALAVMPFIRYMSQSLPSSRHTWTWVGAIFLIDVIVLAMNYKRVQFKNILYIAILLLVTQIHYVLKVYPDNQSMLYTAIIILTSCAVWAGLSTIMMRPLLLTLVACISLYAQLAITQFIFQRDSGLTYIDESIIRVGDAGIATFTALGTTYARAYGPFAHPNSLGGVLVLGIIIFFHVFRRKKLSLSDHTLFSISIICAITLGICLTFSRTALIAGIIPLAYIAYKTRKVFVLFLLISLTLISPLYIGRTTDQKNVSIIDRTTGFEWAINIASPSIILQGIGFGNYERVLKMYLDDNHIFYDSWDIQPVHSIPTLMIIELGLPVSLIIFSATLYYFFKKNILLFLFLIPMFVLDHYFITQLGPLIWLISSAILMPDVYYNTCEDQQHFA